MHPTCVGWSGQKHPCWDCDRGAVQRWRWKLSHQKSNVHAHPYQHHHLLVLPCLFSSLLPPCGSNQVPWDMTLPPSPRSSGKWCVAQLMWKIKAGESAGSIPGRPIGPSRRKRGAPGPSESTLRLDSCAVLMLVLVQCAEHFRTACCIRNLTQASWFCFEVALLMEKWVNICGLI